MSTLNRVIQLEEQQKELVEKLKELTESSVLIWSHNRPASRSYCTDYRGVNFELSAVPSRLQVDFSIGIDDTSGLLDELVWVVEAQLNPRSGDVYSAQTPQDELREVLDKLNAQ